MKSGVPGTVVQKENWDRIENHDGGVILCFQKSVVVHVLSISYY
jgi:hypothetical protein